MPSRYNPPPNWPPPPPGWTPPEGWQPDPAWGPAPDGWQVWVEDEPMPQQGPAPQRPNWFARHKILTGVGGFLLLMFLIGSVTGGDEDDSSPTAQSTPAASATEEMTEAERAAAEQEKAEREAAEKAEAEAAAAAKAEAERVAAEQAAAEAAAEAAKKDPASYAAISSRDYQLLVKDPQAHVGEKYVIYGHVSQFDSATGPDTFRASTDGEQHRDWFDYETNTVVVAEDPSILAPVVQGDLVKMYVEVVGSLTYDTQIGGSTTVPQVTVHIIEVIGSSS